MKAQDKPHLEARIKDLHRSIKGLGDANDLEELALLIHRPGWTTPAEWQFVMGLVESLHTQVAHLVNLKQILMTGSRAVLEKNG
jgi:hypothetical protein